MCVAPKIYGQYVYLYICVWCLFVVHKSLEYSYEYQVTVCTRAICFAMKNLLKISFASRCSSSSPFVPFIALNIDFSFETVKYIYIFIYIYVYINNIDIFDFKYACIHYHQSLLLALHRYNIFYFYPQPVCMYSSLLNADLVQCGDWMCARSTYVY